MNKFSFLLTLCVVMLLTGCAKSILDSDSVVEPLPVLEGEIDDAVDEVLSTMSIEANGTEPFWYFAASGTNLSRTEPSMAGPITATSYTITMTQSGSTITLTHPNLVAVLQLAPCSDGMSDTIYGYTATVTQGAQTFNGCANVTP